MAKIFPVQKGIDRVRFYGPFQVVAALGPFTFRLKDCETDEIIERNIHHLKIITMSEREVSTGKRTTVKSTLVKEPRERRPIEPPDRYGFKKN